MKLIPKIICKHKKKYLKKIFEYNKRPSYEKKFSIKGKYFRSFYQCEICKHIFSIIFINFINLILFPPPRFNILNGATLVDGSSFEDFEFFFGLGIFFKAKIIPFTISSI